MQITVYQRKDAHEFRVVAGEHAAHAGSKAARVAVYPDAQLAYTAETDPAIRAAIARIAPEAAQFIAPLPPIKKIPLRAEHFASRAEQRRVSLGILSCGCCRGPENDRCCCHIHQDAPRGLLPRKCSRHGGGSLS